MDDEWRCSGSKLTSVDAVCGNLARALRRPSTTKQRHNAEVEKELMEHTMEDASRALAAEIPRAPRLEDWAKFKEETGIDIEIDFNQRPKSPDPSMILERLERIEKETSERYEQEKINAAEQTQRDSGLPLMRDFEMWRRPVQLPQFPYSTDVDMFMLFDEDNEIRSVSSEGVMFPGETDSRTE